ncbi:MAG: dihydropteroate synthase [Ferruginibacter sp.]
MFTLNCKGKLISLQKPLVMGIINATPDSFYEGHLTGGQAAMADIAAAMIAAGADILDIGGQSTKPGSQRINVEDEMQRVLPVIASIHERLPAALISIDTYYSRVAEAAVAAGASIVNDISGGNMDKAIIPVVASLQVPYICMHMKGSPSTMQQHPEYDDVIKEVLNFFIYKIDECKRAGIKDIIIDPGFGFGKTINHNFQLLKNLSVFKILERPVLAGISRKGTIYKTLGIDASEALNGTTVLNTLALQNGADILRVHDIKEAKELVLLMEEYKKTAP